MKLGTLGAVIKFAIRIETDLMELARRILENTSDKTTTPKIEDIVSKHRQRIEVLKRLQRENTTEMILEPIVGFDSENFEIDLDSSVDTTGSGELLGLMRRAERTALEFYETAIDKTGFLPEVSDAFEVILKECKDIIERIL